MQSTRNLQSYLLLLVMSLLLAGCGKTVQPKYYLLTPTTGDVVTSDLQQLSIFLGPVSLPKYLDRSQIVTRHGELQLDLADSHRWAEPLQDNFSAVLAEDLRQRVHLARVIVFPARQEKDLDYRVTVNVIRFDTDDRGDAILSADWSIQDEKSKLIITSKRGSYRYVISPASGYTEIVNALSNTIGQLGEDIVDSIKTISQSR